MEYQYSLHNQQVDTFFELVEMGEPNMHRLVISYKISKQDFREYCEFLRDGAGDD